MIKSDAQNMIDYLNDLLQADPEFMVKFISNRSPCNESLDKTSHPLQISTAKNKLLGEDNEPTSEFRCGLLGFLNGYFGAYDNGPMKGWGAIAAKFEADGTISKFTIMKNE